MTPWRVELTKSAKRELRELEEGPRREAGELIQDLAVDPTNIPGAIELRANPNHWRIRFHHNYRILYFIAKAQRRVIVRRIRPRPIAYKGIKH